MLFRPFLVGTKGTTAPSVASGFVGMCGSGSNALEVTAVANIVLGFVKLANAPTPTGMNVPQPAPVPFVFPPPTADNIVRRGAAVRATQARVSSSALTLCACSGHT